MILSLKRHEVYRIVGIIRDYPFPEYATTQREYLIILRKIYKMFNSRSDKMFMLDQIRAFKQKHKIQDERTYKKKTTGVKK